MHYLYVIAPVAFTKRDCEPFKLWLDAEIGQHQPTIHSVQMVMREDLYHFQGNQQSPYLKITVMDPKHISKVRTAFEEGRANWKQMRTSPYKTFDNIQSVLRFMIDCKVYRCKLQFWYIQC